VSNWKNPKGFTVPLDKRLAADGRGLQDVTINDKFAQFSEALFMADRHAREEVRQRALMQQRLAEKEKAQKEESLRMLAQKAREERANASRRRDSGGSRDSRSRSRSRSRSYSYSDSGSDSEESEVRAREKARAEKRWEEERKLRQSRMGAERRIQVMAREQNRDISEKIALGLAKPTAQAESMYDSRLFNRSSGFDSGFNEDNPYDKPLFAAQDAINSIYRPNQNMEDFDDEAAGDREMDRIQKTSRFGEALGRGTFKGVADAEVSSSRMLMLDYWLTNFNRREKGQFNSNATRPATIHSRWTSLWPKLIRALPPKEDMVYKMVTREDLNAQGWRKMMNKGALREVKPSVGIGLELVFIRCIITCNEVDRRIGSTSPN
jgi:SNW domain-containing protein 1